MLTLIKQQLRGRRRAAYHRESIRGNNLLSREFFSWGLDRDKDFRPTDDHKMLTRHAGHYHDAAHGTFRVLQAALSCGAPPSGSGFKSIRCCICCSRSSHCLFHHDDYLGGIGNRCCRVSYDLQYNLGVSKEHYENIPSPSPRKQTITCWTPTAT